MKCKPWCIVCTLVLLYGWMHLIHSCLTLRFSYYTEGNSQTFKAKGSYTLDTGNVFDTEVKKDVNSGSVYAKGKADSGTFMDMLSSFGINPNSLPDFFVNALKYVSFILQPFSFLFFFLIKGIIC